MITENTLFVLGAGASQPFGYPTGKELRKLILSNLSHPPHSLNSKTYYLFNELGIGEVEISKFVEAFYKSSIYSIDAFLEKRSEFLKIGKIAIAHALIPFENENRLLSIDGDWYGYLFNRLIPKCPFESFADNKVSFLTFNYDRSLEQYLFSALINAYGRSPIEVITIMNKIEILHLYGQLGDLPWQEENGQPYDSRRGDHAGYLESSANAIKIVHENVDISQNEVFQKAHHLLLQAKNIYFLGFGYHEMNLDRLRIKEFISGRNLRGTILGLEPSRKRDILRYFQSKIGMVDADSMTFLQKEIDYS